MNQPGVNLPVIGSKSKRVCIESFVTIYTRDRWFINLETSSVDIDDAKGELNVQYTVYDIGSPNEPPKYCGSLDVAIGYINNKCSPAVTRPIQFSEARGIRIRRIDYRLHGNQEKFVELFNMDERHEAGSILDEYKNSHPTQNAWNLSKTQLIWDDSVIGKLRDLNIDCEYYK